MTGGGSRGSPDPPGLPLVCPRRSLCSLLFRVSFTPALSLALQLSTKNARLVSLASIATDLSKLSRMAWYLLPGSDHILSTDDEPLGYQRAQQVTSMHDWTLWNANASDSCRKVAREHFITAEESGLNNESTTFAYCGTTPSSDGARSAHSEGPSVSELQNMELMDDIFMDQFSDEEMRDIEAPFQMFPDSMCRLLSYETMLSDVLTDSQSQTMELDQDGIGPMDTFGFPLFTHDLQDDLKNTDGNLPSCATPNSSEILADPSEDKDGVSTVERISSNADADKYSLDLEAAVLEELEEVVFQLTKKTRVCFRDAFYRLAESSKTQCTENGARITGLRKRCFQQAEGNDSRLSTSVCVEQETNVIDRTVANLMFQLPCSAPQHHENHNIGLEEQTMTSGTTKA